MLDTIYLLTLLLVVALIIAFLPFVAERIRLFARGFIYTQTWITAAAAIYLLIIGAAGMVYVNEDLWFKNHTYATVLAQFSLLETADGKFAQLQAINNQFLSAKLVEVPNASSLTPRPTQRADHWHHLRLKKPLKILSFSSNYWRLPIGFAKTSRPPSALSRF